MSGAWPYLAACLVLFLVGLLLGRSMSHGRAQRTARLEMASSQGEVLAALDRIIEGDRAGGYEILARVAKGRDASPEIYFALAALLRTLGRSERSAQVYRTILARPSLPKALVHRARVGLARELVATGRGAEAKAVIDELPRKLRAESGLLALQKEAALQRGDWAAALSAGHALAKAEGENGSARAEVLARIAEEAAARGDVESAHRGFRKALRLAPDLVRARQGLARLFLSEGKVSRARRQLLATLESNPSLAPVVLPQLRDLLAGDRDEQARFDDLLEALETHPGVRLWVGLERADRLYRAEQHDACRHLLERLLKEHPRSIEAHEAYLNLLLYLEDDKALEQEIERLVDLASEEIPRFRCGRCGYLSPAPFMECPSCRAVGELIYDA